MLDQPAANYPPIERPFLCWRLTSPRQRDFPDTPRPNPAPYRIDTHSESLTIHRYITSWNVCILYTQRNILDSTFGEEWKKPLEMDVVEEMP